MKRTRLFVLVAAAVALGLARWLMPLGRESADSGLAAAVVRPTSAIASRHGAPAAVGESRAAASQDDDFSAAGNAFAIKAPPVPPPLPPTKKAIVAAAPPSPPASALPSLPQMQVIGTYDDAAGPAVFVATANGTEIGRVGSLLLAEFRVTAITRQQVSLVQISSKRAVHLGIPRQ